MVTSSRTLVFALGPVQGFIAQSRRTADGWMGSYLLSYLMGRAIVALQDDGHDVREPRPTGRMVRTIEAAYAKRRRPVSGVGETSGPVPVDDPRIAELPNTIVVDVAAGIVPDNVGRVARRTVVDEAWPEISKAIWTALPEAITKASGVEAMWKDQVGRLWETYWAWGQTASEAYKNLAARKALRDFPRWEEAGDRCSVCGQRAPLCDGRFLPPADREPVPPEERTVQAATRRTWGGRRTPNGSAPSGAGSGGVATAQDDVGWGRQLLNHLRGTIPSTPSTLVRTDGRERFCAICLIKRLAPWVDNPIWRHLSAQSARQNAAPKRTVTTGDLAAFPSTATMATVHARCDLLEVAAANLPLRNALGDYTETLDQELRRRPDRPESEPDPMKPRMRLDSFSAWTACAAAIAKGSQEWKQKALGLLCHDGDFFLYGESVANEYGLGSAEHRKVNEKYRAMRKAARSAGVPEMPIYWALLAMDGDSMGRFLRQVDDADIGGTGEISEILSVFAGSVPGIVEKCNGRTIFAGGDDVLAMFSMGSPRTAGDAGSGAAAMPDVLQAAERLRVDFARRFKNWHHQRNLNGIRRDALPTLSGAIVLAHHQAPLGRVIAQGQSLLEHWAKTKAGRNALAVQRFQRGGEAETFAARWEDERGTRLTDRMHRTVGLFRGPHDGGGQAVQRRPREVAGRFAYNLRMFEWLLGQRTFFSEHGHRSAFAASLLLKSRLDEGPTSGGAGAEPTDVAARHEARRARALERVEHLLAVCDVSTEAASRPGTLATEPMILARFMAGEGREER